MQFNTDVHDSATWRETTNITHEHAEIHTQYSKLDIKIKQICLGGGSGLRKGVEFNGFKMLSKHRITCQTISYSVSYKQYNSSASQWGDEVLHLIRYLGNNHGKKWRIFSVSFSLPVQNC